MERDVERDVEWIRPDWEPPPGVVALTTTRRGGVSEPPMDTWNLAHHVDDDPAAVRENRERLRRAARLPAEPCWLDQVHSADVVEAGEASRGARADASFTSRSGVVCAVLTADCLPVVLCDRRGREVAVAHAGWRGLAAGVVEVTVARLASPPDEILAWLGPAIGPDAFEVGPEVRDAFVRSHDEARGAFRPARPGHYLADLALLARWRLERLGVRRVHASGLCTHTDARRFFSYRRDGPCGRMATLVWRHT